MHAHVGLAVARAHALAWQVLNSRHQSKKITSQRAAGLIVRGEIGGLSVHTVSLLGIGRSYASVSSVHALGSSVHALGSSVHGFFACFFLSSVTINFTKCPVLKSCQAPFWPLSGPNPSKRTSPAVLWFLGCFLCGLLCSFLSLALRFVH